MQNYFEMVLNDRMRELGVGTYDEFVKKIENMEDKTMDRFVMKVSYSKDVTGEQISEEYDQINVAEHMTVVATNIFPVEGKPHKYDVFFYYKVDNTKLPNKPVGDAEDKPEDINVDDIKIDL